tara:strand:- start:488 stop:943 length:456 start_codon:yes stop_codon:yes gene_type:complete
MNKALRYNDDKPELSELLQFGNGLEALAKVMSQGGVKYEHRNWLRGGKPDQEYMDSAMRHLLSIAGGEHYDSDTGCTHAAHVAWNMLAMLRLNYEDVPVLDETFDQRGYLERYTIPTTGYKPLEVTEEDEQFLDPALAPPLQHWLDSLNNE